MKQTHEGRRALRLAAAGTVSALVIGLSCMVHLTPAAAAETRNRSPAEQMQAQAVREVEMGEATEVSEAAEVSEAELVKFPHASGEALSSPLALAAQTSSTLAPLAPKVPLPAAGENKRVQSLPTQDARGSQQTMQVGTGNGEPSKAEVTLPDGSTRAMTEEELLQLQEVEKTAAKVRRMVHSAEFRRQIDEVREQTQKARARVDSPELRKQMEEAQQEARKAQAMVDSPEFRKQVEEARTQARKARARVDSPEFRKQMEEAREQARKAQEMVNSAEFKKQIEDARRQAEQVRLIMDDPQIQKNVDAIHTRIRELKEQRRSATEKK